MIKYYAGTCDVCGESITLAFDHSKGIIDIGIGDDDRPYTWVRHLEGTDPNCKIYSSRVYQLDEKKDITKALETLLWVVACECDLERFRKGQWALSVLGKIARQLEIRDAEYTRYADLYEDEYAKVADLREVLVELVSLKDGPRDTDYYDRKPLVWEKARALLGDVKDESFPTTAILDNFNRSDGFLRSNWTKSWQGIGDELSGWEYWGTIHDSPVLRAGWKYGIRVQGGTETVWRQQPGEGEWVRLVPTDPEAVAWRALAIRMPQGLTESRPTDPDDHYDPREDWTTEPGTSEASD